MDSLRKKRPPRLSPGIHESVQKLMESGKTVYLVSGGFRQMVNKIVSVHIQISNLFHVGRGDQRWVEHDPIEILESVKMCISKAIDKANVDGYNFDNGLKAIGVTDKRESTNFWSESTGVPL
ncbi:glycerol kinase [Tanacetum coccineum]